MQSPRGAERCLGTSVAHWFPGSGTPGQRQNGGHTLESVISAGLIGLSLGTQYALISIGFTLIFSIMGVVNFAHGGFYILGGYFAFSLSHALGLPFAVAVVLAALGTGILGYVIERLVIEKYVVDHL